MIRRIILISWRGTSTLVTCWIPSLAKAAVGGTGDNKAEYLVLAATGSLTAERVFTAGLGLNGTDGGAGSNYTLKVLDSIVATLTGSQFSGNVGITGSLEVKTGDFRVESAGEDQALFLDASANTLYVNKGSTGFTTLLRIRITRCSELELEVRYSTSMVTNS